MTAMPRLRPWPLVALVLLGPALAAATKPRRAAPDIVERIRRTTVPRVRTGEPHVTVYRGLRCPLERFNPEAREYQHGQHNVFVAHRFSQAAGYALTPDAAVSEGIILELKVPIGMFMKAGGRELDLNQLPGHDLSPYITRVGVVHLDRSRFTADQLLPGHLASIDERLRTLSARAELPRQFLRLAGRRGSKAVFEPRPAGSLTPRDVEDLNAAWERIENLRQMTARDPSAITWKKVRSLEVPRLSKEQDGAWHYGYPVSLAR